MNQLNFLKLLLKFFGFSLLCLPYYSHAHYPHDVSEFIALSPNFSTDETVFTAQKQASSVRPHVALVSRNGGNSWQHTPVGLDNISKITSAVVSPLYSIDQTVILTTASEGVYRSLDAGYSWTQANQGLNNLHLNNSAATVDNNGKVVLYVTGEQGGMYRSRNFGESWKEIIPVSTVISAFSISPGYSTDNTLLVSDGSGTLFISENQGNSFSALPLVTGVGRIQQIAFTPDYSLSGEVYIGSTTGLFYSSDRANSFTPVTAYTAGSVSGLAISPGYVDDLTLFVTNPAQGVYKTTDAGKSWTLHTIDKVLSGQTGNHYISIKLSDAYESDGIVFITMFEGLFRSDNGGVDWREQDPRPAGLIYDIALSPDFIYDRKILVSTYGGGLYLTDNAGQNWRSINVGLPELNTYQVAFSGGNGVTPAMLATQGNNLLTTDNNGANWVAKAITDSLPAGCIPSAFELSPDYTTDNTMYIGCRKDGLIRSQDAGTNWNVLISTEEMAGGSLVALQASPDFGLDNSFFLADSRGNIARSIDKGNNWKIIDNGLPKRYYGGSSIHVSPDYNNDKLLFAATGKGLFGSLNGGNGWGGIPDINSPVASGVIEAFGFSPDFSQDHTLLASVRGIGLFRSDDASLSWQQVGEGLQENGYQLSGFVFSPDFANDGVIIGYSHDHLLYSSDRGNSFVLFDIPYIRHDDNRKQSVTYNGHWELVDTVQANANSLHAINKAGRESMISFWGTGVSWIGMSGNNLGIADVFIDGNLQASVDLYGAQQFWQQTVFTVNNLPEGLHELKVVTTGKKNALSTDSWVVIDAFDVIR